MTILEKMARVLVHHNMLCSSKSETQYMQAARAARDAMVEGLTDEHLNRCDEAGHCAAIEDLDRDALYFDAFRAALLELTEVDDG